MVYAVQLISTNEKREYRVTGEMHEYIQGIIKSAEGLRGVFETEVGEH